MIARLPPHETKNEPCELFLLALRKKDSRVKLLAIML